jgi:hypothetical protein
MAGLRKSDHATRQWEWEADGAHFGPEIELLRPERT